MRGTPLNKVPGQDKWLWTEVSAGWLNHADQAAAALARGLQAGATSEGRHRHTETQAPQASLGMRGVVAYHLATGQRVPSVAELLERDRQMVAEAHHYKLRAAHNLSRPDYGFIWHEKDTRYRNATHFLLMYQAIDNEHRWAIVGELSIADARELSVEGTWLPTENKVASHVYFKPYAGPILAPPPASTACPHGEPLGVRCFICAPLRLEFFPPQNRR